MAFLLAMVSYLSRKQRQNREDIESFVTDRVREVTTLLETKLLFTDSGLRDVIRKQDDILTRVAKMEGHLGAGLGNGGR